MAMGFADSGNGDCYDDDVDDGHKHNGGFTAGPRKQIHSQRVSLCVLEDRNHSVSQIDSIRTPFGFFFFFFLSSNLSIERTVPLKLL